MLHTLHTGTFSQFKDADVDVEGRVLDIIEDKLKNVWNNRGVWGKVLSLIKLGESRHMAAIIPLWIIYD